MQGHFSQFDAEAIGDGLVCRDHVRVNGVRRSHRHVLDVSDESGNTLIILYHEPRVREHTVEDVLLDVTEDLLLSHEKGKCVPHPIRGRDTD